MANDLLELAKREAEALRTELSRLPIYQKLQQVQRLIDVYESVEKTGPEAETSARVDAGTIRPQTKLGQVEEIVLGYLSSEGTRKSSGQLLTLLTERGVRMGGRVPAKTLASMLSNSSKLNNLKGHGYGPVEWGASPGNPAKTNEAPANSSAGASKSESGGSTNTGPRS